MERAAGGRGPFQCSDRIIEPSHSNNHFASAHHDPYDMGAGLPAAAFRPDCTNIRLHPPQGAVPQEVSFTFEDERGRKQSPAALIMTPAGPMTYTTASGKKE